MRSMYVSMLALALTVLLCACVSNVPVWETVDDAQVCQGESRLPSTIVFAVPDGAAVQTFSASGAAQSCSAQDGSYEITATVLTEDDPESAIRALTGFDADRLQIRPDHALFSAGISVRMERRNRRRRAAVPRGDALR